MHLLIPHRQYPNSLSTIGLQWAWGIADEVIMSTQGDTLVPEPADTQDDGQPTSAGFTSADRFDALSLPGAELQDSLQWLQDRQFVENDVRSAGQVDVATGAELRVLHRARVRSDLVVRVLGQHLSDRSTAAVRILVIEAGSGALLDRLRLNFGRVRGCILSRRDLSLGRAQGRRLADVSLRHFPDRAFDAVICADATQGRDVTKCGQELLELRRVVRDGGMLFSFESKVAVEEHAEAQGLGADFANDPTPLNTAIRLLQAAGFGLVTQRRCGLLPCSMYERTPWLDAFMGQLGLGADCCTIASVPAGQRTPRFVESRMRPPALSVAQWLCPTS